MNNGFLFLARAHRLDAALMFPQAKECFRAVLHKLSLRRQTIKPRIKLKNKKNKASFAPPPVSQYVGLTFPTVVSIFCPLHQTSMVSFSVREEESTKTTSF